MPFIVRIGYVFIILTVVFVGISLTDNANTAPAPEETADRRRKTLRTGRWLVSISVIIGIILSFFVNQMASFALDSAYTLVVGFLLLGIVLITDASRLRMNPKAIVFRPELIKTTLPFNIVAIAICGLLAFLYIYFR
jgi:hypothetical protein